MISQRIKEIAVRKVLGATLSSMVYLFSKDFVRLVILANLIALPIVYIIVNKLVEQFCFSRLYWMDDVRDSSPYFIDNFFSYCKFTNYQNWFCKSG